MPAGLMAEMCEVRTLWFYLLYELQSLADGEMSEMIILAKRVYDKHIEILEFLLLHIRYGLGIRHVCERPYPVAENRQFAMVYLYRDNLETINVKGIVAYYLHVEMGNTGIRLLAEAVVESFSQMAVYILANI